jgi:hypothetical protein
MDPDPDPGGPKTRGSGSATDVVCVLTVLARPSPGSEINFKPKGQDKDIDVSSYHSPRSKLDTGKKGGEASNSSDVRHCL